jgi:hypothetical protein
MSELLSLPLLPGVSSTPNDVPASGMQAMLIKADFHGSIISGSLPLYIFSAANIHSQPSAMQQKYKSSWALRNCHQ